MPLKYGDPAHPADVWMRVLTNPNYVKNGKVHNKAFGGKAIAPPIENRPWSLELSGRLLSLTQNVEKESEDFCSSIAPRKYAGLVYQHVETIRRDASSHPTFRVDVIYTPNDDNAHSDVVAYELSLEEKYELRDWLQDHILYVAPGNCGVVEKLRSVT